MSASKEQKIAIGQEWQEDKYARRLMRVTEIKAGEVRAWSRDPDRVKLAMVTGAGRPFAEMKDYTLRSGWTLVKDAEGSPPRRIALAIAPATETHCGTSHLPQERCRFASFDHGHWFCRSIGSGFAAGGMNGLAVPERLPECRAAEVR